jgi:hypothetical protein
MTSQPTSVASGPVARLACALPWRSSLEVNPARGAAEHTSGHPQHLVAVRAGCGQIKDGGDGAALWHGPFSPYLRHGVNLED